MGRTGFMKSTEFFEGLFSKRHEFVRSWNQSTNRRGFVGLAHFKDGSDQNLGYLLYMVDTFGPHNNET